LRSGSTSNCSQARPGTFISAASRSSRSCSNPSTRQKFDPAGIAGLAYWYTLWPIHDYIFGGMLQRIATASAAT